MQQHALVGLGVLTLAAGLASCSAPKSDNALYQQLAAIMDERKLLWDTPGGEGSRKADVSEIVCPVAKEKELDQMAADKNLAGFVEYKFYERSTTYPDNTKLWIVNKPDGVLDKQVLMIELSPNDVCFAAYRPKD